MKLPLDRLDKLLHSLLEPVAIVTSARELTSAGPAVLWTQLPPAATSGHPADHPLRHQVLIGRGVDHVRGDTHSIARAQNRSFHNSIHIEFSANLWQRLLLFAL